MQRIIYKNIWCINGGKRKTIKKNKNICRKVDKGEEVEAKE
jgi:hypothetical protein